MHPPVVVAAEESEKPVGGASRGDFKKVVNRRETRLPRVLGARLPRVLGARLPQVLGARLPQVLVAGLPRVAN